MKTTIILFMLSISFLPLAITGLGDVLDIDGNPLVAGVEYYAAPVPIGVEGAISVEKSTFEEENPSACPTNVVINLTSAGHIPWATGRPIVFYPLNLENTASSGANTATIQESFPLNVAFATPDPSDPCAKETVWRLGGGSVKGVALILTGGVIGNEENLYSWFRIAKNVNGRGYIFTYWPSLCLGCKIGTSRIGLVTAENQLGINEDLPYPFYFVRADKLSRQTL